MLSFVISIILSYISFHSLFVRYRTECRAPWGLPGVNWLESARERLKVGPLVLRDGIGLKTKVDNLPVDGITQEELDRVLAEGNFRPKTDALLRQAKRVCSVDA